MSVLTNENKHLILHLSALGKTSRFIAAELGIGKSTVGDFLRKQTYQKWWANRDGPGQAAKIARNTLCVSPENFKHPKDFLKPVCQATRVPDEAMKKAVAAISAMGSAFGAFDWDNPATHMPIIKKEPYIGPKILTLDIETAPIMASVWRLFDQNVGLSMIEQDWYVLSWAAKWMHEDTVMYEDKADTFDDEHDKDLLGGIHKLLDEADIIITQNGKKFDAKKLNARFILNGMKPPSSYRHIDTLQEAKRHFGFTSNKLEYMTDKLCKKYKKLKHGKFPGFELWKECLRGNPEAWQEMKDYNIHDVLSLEELYKIMLPWMKTHINMNVYSDDIELLCKCGHNAFEHNGYAYTNLSKYDRFACTECGSEVRGRVNLLSKEKRKSLRMNITQ